MLTAEQVIHFIFLLPRQEKEKLVRYIVEYGVMNVPHDSAEILDLKQWQSEIAETPFNLIQASEYLGLSQSELRECVKKGLLRASGFPELCTFNVLDLKEFKKQYVAGDNKGLGYKPPTAQTCHSK